MTQSDHSGRRSPRRRGGSRPDSIRPAPARPGGRRGGDRRPWPTATTTTRVSPGKTTAGTGRVRSRGSSSNPTPATVWTAGADPIDLDATWPAALIERVVVSFSEPAARVVLLDWPTPNHTRPTLTAVGADGGVGGVDGPARGAEPDRELGDAVAVVERLDRTAHVEHVPVDPTVTDPASRPFWADLVGGSGPAPAPVATGEAPAPHAVTGPVDGAALIVTSLLPDRAGGRAMDRAADLVALYAARRLRVGGILVVLTHCDWTSGELIDPTGAVVAAGQNADLLYLQHIVAVHAPVRDGRFQLADTHPNNNTDSPNAVAGGESDADVVDTRARHRALVRGLPEPHRRIHSDVLVFAQPQSPVGSREVTRFQDEPTGGSARSLGSGRSVRGEEAGACS